MKGERKRIYYKTAYDNRNGFDNYVIATDTGKGYYTITKRQYRRAYYNRTIAGDVGVMFNSDMPVWVVNNYGEVIL